MTTCRYAEWDEGEMEILTFACLVSMAAGTSVT